ncbi:MAG: parvulin peptidyl-prolyl isomerase, partial [Chloroflexaceae bacterium]|nr:parvulin peptidyl-prolyl isomerase [Chloroflexaceae bacterium]
MDSPKFLSIDEENISIAQALQYLREAGELPKLVQRVLRQHVLGQVMAETTIAVDEPAVEQAIVNFRIQNRLTNQEQFQQWLQSR